MNKEEFIKQLYEQMNVHTINIDLLSKWYGSILNKLKIASQQAGVIKHPRHRGDAREDDIKEIITKMIPSNFGVTKGYAINSSSIISLEQDCIIYKKALYSPLISTNEIDYLPIESIYSSIEIKSKLTLEELRKCIINCASIKKLMYNEKINRSQEDKKHDIIYSIFAYDSDYSLEQIAEKVNDLNTIVDKKHRVNMIFVLGKGIIVPKGSDGRIGIDYNEILKIDEGYIYTDKLTNRTEEEFEALPFLLFMAYILDFLINDSDSKMKDFYARYVFDPIIWLQRIDKEKHREKVPDTFITKGETRRLIVNAVSCKKCNQKYKFYFDDTFDSDAHKKLKLQGFTFISEEYKNNFICKCGNTLNPGDFEEDTTTQTE